MTTLINGIDSLSTIRMFEAPVTDLAKFIGENWFLPIETLAERADVGMSTISKILKGKDVSAEIETKVRNAIQGGVMNREKEKAIIGLFRNYKANKRKLAQDYNIPTPSGVAYDKIKVKGDLSKNVVLEQTVSYISEREELYKKVFIVDEVLTWYKMEGHGREKFIKLFFIENYSWIRTERVCNIAESTLASWRREVLEKAEMVAKWVNFF